MRRRLTLLFTVLCIAALGVTAVALAQGDKKDGKRGDGRPASAEQHRHGRGGPGPFLGGHGLLGVVLDSLAGRLSVQPADLKKAVREVVAERQDEKLQAAGLTRAEIDALKTCRRTRGLHRRAGAFKKRDAARIPRAHRSGAACDTDAAKSGIAKLRAAGKTKPDLAALKADLAQSLATKLGKTPEEILTAVRAELDARLAQAVGIGLVTQKGHDLALACFDDPAACDLQALRAEVRFRGHHGRKGDRRDGDRPMHPGGRRSGHPLG
jgi:hypothetical protein